MADSKISDLTDGSFLKAADEVVVARAGSNYRISGSYIGTKVYDYTVTGSDKASIDTNVDGSLAALFPTDFAVLEVLLYARTDETAILSVLDITLNNDTGNNYDVELLRGRGSTASASALAGSPGAAAQVISPGASALANVFGTTHILMPNYSGTVGYKPFSTAVGIPDNTSSAESDLYAMGYRSTSAVTRVKVAPTTAGKKLKVGTRLLVYVR